MLPVTSNNKAGTHTFCKAAASRSLLAELAFFQWHRAPNLEESVVLAEGCMGWPCSGAYYCPGPSVRCASCCPAALGHPVCSSFSQPPTSQFPSKQYLQQVLAVPVECGQRQRVERPRPTGERGRCQSVLTKLPSKCFLRPIESEIGVEPRIDPLITLM